MAEVVITSDDVLMVRVTWNPLIDHRIIAYIMENSKPYPETVA